MSELNLHEFHQTVTKTALGLSESLDAMTGYTQLHPVLMSMHRRMKAQLRILIDQGIKLGELLERADVKDTDPSQLTSSDDR